MTYAAPCPADDAAGPTLVDSNQSATAERRGIDIFILLAAAWITFFGLLGVVLIWYAQADAAREKLVTEWALSRREMERRQARAPEGWPRS